MNNQTNDQTDQFGDQLETMVYIDHVKLILSALRHAGAIFPDEAFSKADILTRNEIDSLSILESVELCLEMSMITKQ